MEWLFFMSAGCALLAVLISAVSLRFSMRGAHRHPTLNARLTNLETDQTAILDRVDKLATYAKKKYHRDAARESRARSNGFPDSATDPEGWKREMMKRHVLGDKA